MPSLFYGVPHDDAWAGVARLAAARDPFDYCGPWPVSLAVWEKMRAARALTPRWPRRREVTP